MHTLFQVCSQGAPSVWLLCLFNRTYSFSITSLISGTKLYFRIFLYFHIPALDQPSLQRSVFFHWRVIFTNQDLGTRCVHCSWALLFSRPTQWTELENLYLYSNLRYPHLHLSLSTYKNILKTMDSYYHLQFQFNTTGFILVFSFSLFVTIFSDHKKCGTHYLQCFTYFRIASPHCYEKKKY